MFLMAIQQPYSPSANTALCGLAVNYATKETGCIQQTTYIEYPG